MWFQLDLEGISELTTEETRFHHYYFNSRIPSIFFGEMGNRFHIIWRAHICFGNAVHMIVHVNFGVDFRGLKTSQVCTVLEWLHSNIVGNFNVAFCQTFEHKHEILYQTLGPDLTHKTVCTAVGVIFVVSLPDFGYILPCSRSHSGWLV